MRITASNGILVPFIQGRGRRSHEGRAVPAEKVEFAIEDAALTLLPLGDGYFGYLPAARESRQPIALAEGSARPTRPGDDEYLGQVHGLQLRVDQAEPRRQAHGEQGDEQVHEVPHEHVDDLQPQQQHRLPRGEGEQLERLREDRGRVGERGGAHCSYKTHNNFFI